MKADTEYSHIKVCPKTEEQLGHSDIFDTDGVCPKCGHNDYLITHSKKIVGRYIRPSLIERIFKGKRTEFITKGEEDKVWGTLKSE